MEILKINGHDYSPYVKSKGFGWSREDLDSDKTIRTKNGKMRRHKITTKRKLSYTMLEMNQNLLATKTFYCSSFSANISEVWDGDTDIWEGASFNIIEV